MSRDTDKELQELIQRGRRSIADIHRFLADSERRRNGATAVRKSREKAHRKEVMRGVSCSQGHS
jgi:hypothetical protein